MPIYFGLIFLVSFILSLICIWGFSKLFRYYKILDNPKKYRKKRKPIPYSMGIIFFLVFFVISFFTLDHSFKLSLIWLLGGIITVISFIDDRIHIKAQIRLIIQICIGAIIGLTSIKIGYISNIFGGIINLETYFIVLFGIKIYLIPLFFTIIWYVFVFNALNWSDGIQGNTSGISIISFGILFLLGAILLGQDNYQGSRENAMFIMQISIILLGTLLAFWYFDVREKILMGDAGTMFLGFMLATLAIISGGKVATVLVVFGIYSVDAIYVIIKRILKQKNPFQGDFTHLHNRLLDIGFSKKQILTIIYFISLFAGLSSLFLDKIGKIILFVGIIFFVIFVNKISIIRNSHKNKKQK